MPRHLALVALAILLWGCAWTAPGNPVQPPQLPAQVESPAQQAATTGPGSVLQAPPSAPAPDPLAEPPRGAFDYPLSQELKVRVLPADGAMPSVTRTTQLLRLSAKGWELVNAVSVPGLPGGTVAFWREDLPGYPGAIVMEASRGNGVRHGAVAVIEGRLMLLDYYKVIAPVPEQTEGVFLFLNKYMNQVWVYRDGSLIATFATANGRDPWGKQPTWVDYKTNYKTPEGLFSVRQKVVNPPYNNLGGHLAPVAGGAPNNPLGTRWIGLGVLPGDGGGIWGMHGTYVPEQIGTWASEGCIRLNTADAEKLFDMVQIGSMVRIISGI